MPAGCRVSSAGGRTAQGVMAQYFLIHPTHPQRHLIARAVQIVRDGGLLVYPTDSCYALGSRIGDKDANQENQNE